MGQVTFNVTVEGEEPNVQWTDFVQVTPDITIAPSGTQWVEIPGFVNNGDVIVQVFLDGVTVENVGDATTEVAVVDQGFELNGSWTPNPSIDAHPGDNAKLMFSLQNTQEMGEDPETVSVTVDYKVQYDGIEINPDGTAV